MNLAVQAGIIGILTNPDVQKAVLTNPEVHEAVGGIQKDISRNLPNLGDILRNPLCGFVFKTKTTGK